MPVGIFWILRGTLGPRISDDFQQLATCYIVTKEQNLRSPFFLKETESSAANPPPQAISEAEASAQTGAVPATEDCEPQASHGSSRLRAVSCISGGYSCTGPLRVGAAGSQLPDAARACESMVNAVNVFPECRVQLHGFSRHRSRCIFSC